MQCYICKKRATAITRENKPICFTCSDLHRIDRLHYKNCKIPVQTLFWSIKNK